MWQKYFVNTSNKGLLVKAVLNNSSIDNTGVFVNFDMGLAYFATPDQLINWEYYFSGLGTPQEVKWTITKVA